MAYKVVVTNDAKENMQEYIEYILYEKRIGRQRQAARPDFSRENMHLSQDQAE